MVHYLQTFFKACIDRRHVCAYSGFMRPSDKQIKYALYLLGKCGYSTRFMNAQFKELGATMRQRSGSVDAWLFGMSSAEISDLIGQLKDRAA